LINDLTQHQSDIILNFLFLLSFFDEFGHLIWIKLSVYSCLELGDVFLYHGETSSKPGVPNIFKLSQSVLR
jgi:hypothetical protein